ncbi:MAG: helix-turn-helix domain-containing protein [Bifidobacteriaceae bacterium]|jgi:hypothetical protein|nr:helix-turn-helix domain-containing protein [Bifidobacteriaceae bacterium]
MSVYEIHDVPPTAQPMLLTHSQAAEALCMSEKALYQKAQAGEIAYVVVSAKKQPKRVTRRYTHAAIQEWIRSNSVAVVPIPAKATAPGGCLAPRGNGSPVLSARQALKDAQAKRRPAGRSDQAAPNGGRPPVRRVATAKGIVR